MKTEPDVELKKVTLVFGQFLLEVDVEARKGGGWEPVKWVVVWPDYIPGTRRMDIREQRNITREMNDPPPGWQGIAKFYRDKLAEKIGEEGV